MAAFRKPFWTALVYLGCAQLANAAGLRDHLTLFFDLGSGDSVVSVAKRSPTQLQIEVEDAATGDRRTLWKEVGEAPMEKLLAAAQDEGVRISARAAAESAPASDEGAPSPAVPARAAPAKGAAPAADKEPAPRRSRSLSSQRKNRIWYIGNQTALSTYVYGVALPAALDAQSVNVIVATPMIVAPLAFGAHLFYARTRTFEDAHLKGTTYFSLASVWGSYALPGVLFGWDFDTFRAGGFISMAAYPLGVWAGYGLGDQYVDMPGRIDIQSNFFLGFGALGFLTPLLYFEHPSDHAEALWRLMFGQSAALSVGGHFLAEYYRSGENVPEGVSLGFMNHTALGAGLGLEIAALADAGSLRPWTAALVLGGTAGFAEGLYYFRDKYDSRERGYYNSLGQSVGILMGAGFLVLMSDNLSSEYQWKVATASCLVGGAWVGYWATNFLTQGMEDRSGRREASWTDRLAVNLVPFPEPQLRDQEMYLRYRVPGISYRW